MFRVIIKVAYFKRLQELVQNAEDAGAGVIKILYNPKELQPTSGEFSKYLRVRVFRYLTLLSKIFYGTDCSQALLSRYIFFKFRVI